MARKYRSGGIVTWGTGYPAARITRPASGQELVDESPFSARCRDIGANCGAIDVVTTALSAICFNEPRPCWALHHRKLR